VTIHLSRRAFLSAAAGTGLLLAAGCSSDKTNTGGTSSSVTIKHVFGETNIPSPPKRVVSAGLTEQDDLLAVGVVPIAVTNWFGDQPFGVWPWAQPKLGSAQPAVLNLDGGVQIEQIAALKPDLIVATNAGLDADTYKKLSAIAPTIAQSGTEAHFEPWKDQANAIGQAVFQGDQMTGLINAVETKFSEAAKNNPKFKDKNALLLAGKFTGDKLPATVGWRSDFLTQMGFKIPDRLTPYASDHEALIPRDKLASVLDEADVLIWTTENDEEQAALLADPAIAALDATKKNKHVFTGKELTGAIVFGSPLSYPVVADRLPPLLAPLLS
jgi:iron complex transport system substrate-binding protein